MSNNQPTATAVIRFFPDKKVTVEIDSLVGVSPRRLERAGHLLMREYRGKRHQHNAKRHSMARVAAEVEAENAAIAEVDFHEKEDKRLAKASKSAKKRHKEFYESVEPEQEGEDSPETEDESVELRSV